MKFWEVTDDALKYRGYVLRPETDGDPSTGWEILTGDDLLFTAASIDDAQSIIDAWHNAP